MLIKVIKEFLSFIKFLIKFSLAVFIIIAILLALVRDYLVDTAIYDFPNEDLSHIVNSVLNIPYHQQEYFKNDSSDITKISTEQWMNLKCSPRQFDKVDHLTLSKHKTKNLPLSDIWHLNCVHTIPLDSKEDKKNKTVSGELCNSYHDCHTLNIAIGDYVFQQPEILWNIIKIAENPCSYIKELEKLKTELETNKDKDYEWKIHEVDSIRDHLCGRYSRKFVLITVMNETNYRIMDIIVRRKDVD